MNKQSLDERIDEIVRLTHTSCGYQKPCPVESASKRAVRELFKDVIQEVLPEKKDQLSQSTLEDESRCRFYYYGGYNRAIDTINSNVDSLLTGEKK